MGICKHGRPTWVFVSTVGLHGLTFFSFELESDSAEMMSPVFFDCFKYDTEYSRLILNVSHDVASIELERLCPSLDRTRETVSQPRSN